MKLKQLTTALAAASLLTLTGPLNTSFAANHPLSQTSNTLDANGVEFVDLTVNVDWDFNGGVKHFNDANTTLDKEFLRAQIGQLARSVFVMSNGKQKLRNVYVFNKKEFGENVDIQLINKEGRAYATGFSGFGFEGFSTYNFLGMNNAAEGQAANVVTEAFLGQVVAHELGHYFYGFADEYKEDGKALDPNMPGAPSGVDTPLNTIMNNHESFARLSTAEDYNASIQTAQGRVYKLSNNQGASAWETLIRNPALDSDVAKGDGGHSGRRKWFAAFKNLSVPAASSLLSNSAANAEGIAGYDSNLNIILKDGNTQQALGTTWSESVGSVVKRRVLVIDRTLPSATLSEAIASAKAILAKEASVSSGQAKYGVMVYPFQSGLNLPTQLSSSANEINALIAKLASIQADTTGTLDLQQLFDNVTTGMLSASAGSASADGLEILTRQGATAPADLGNAARTAKVALNIVGFRVPATAAAPAPAANTVSLATAAKQSGGEFSAAKNSAEATRDLIKADNALNGKVLNLIDAESSDALPANGTKVVTFFQSKKDYDGDTHITLYVDPSDVDKVGVTYGQKGGSTSTVTYNSAIEGIIVDKANGRMDILVQNFVTTDGGFKELEVTVKATNTPMSDGFDIEVAGDAATATNAISLGATVVGGEKAAATAPVITARFGGNKPIRGGELKVTVQRVSDGAAVLTDVAMLDDGVGADERANDGVYTLSLKDKLPSGDYMAVVQASTVPGISAFNPNQIRANANAPARAETPIADEIQRLAEVEFSLEAGAKGVTASATAPAANGSDSDSGGGCTALPGQADASLLALVLGAAGLSAWRRRQRQR